MMVATYAVAAAGKGADGRALVSGSMGACGGLLQPYGDLDLVLVRVTVEGKRGSDSSKIIYEVIDRQQSKESLTAMMRMTAFPAAIVAWMAASGQVNTRGAKPPELAIDPAAFIPHLKKRGINLTIKES